MTVWTYWEGAMPYYIQVCLESVKRTCKELCVVTPDTLHYYLPADALHPNYLLLEQPALRADCIRAALLAYNGGFWFDADTVGIKDPTCLLVDDPAAVYTHWDKEPYRILNGYIYLARKSDAALQWLEQVNEAIGRKDASWCSLGEKLLTGLLVGKGKQVRRSTFLPIDIDSSVATFFSPRDYREFLEDNTVCYGLNHSWFMYHRHTAMTLSYKQWASSPLLIHQLLNSVHYA